MLENIDNDLNKIISDISVEKLSTPNFVPGISPIPVTGKVIDKSDLLNLVDSSLDAWFTSGRYTEEFEKNYLNFLELGIAFLLIVAHLQTS